MRTRVLALVLMAACSKKAPPPPPPADAAAVAPVVADAAKPAAPDAAPAPAPPPDAAPPPDTGVVELDLDRGYSSGPFEAQKIKARVQPPPGWKRSDMLGPAWEPDPPVHPTGLSVATGLDWQPRATASALLDAGIKAAREQAGSDARSIGEKTEDLANGGRIVTWVVDARATRGIRHGESICLYAQDGQEWVVRIQADYPEGDTATATLVRAVCDTFEVIGLQPATVDTKPAIELADGNLNALPADAFTVVVDRPPFWTSMHVTQPLDVAGVQVSANYVVVKDGDGHLQEFHLRAPHEFPTPLDGVTVTCAADEDVELDDGKLTSCLLDAPVKIGKYEYARWTELQFMNGKPEPPEKKKR